MQSPQLHHEPSRRHFMGATAASAATLAAISQPLHAGAFAAGSDLLKVGLVGCGGRGTGAAEQALNADPSTELVAIGDIFEDATERARRTLTRMFNQAGGAPRVTVSDDTCY